MQGKQIPKEYPYSICHVTISRGDQILFNQYVFLNPDETPDDPDETPEVVIRCFNALKERFEGMHAATVYATTRINSKGGQIKAQRLRGFDFELHKCPKHSEEKGAWCPKCGAQLFRIVVINNINHLGRGYAK